MYQTSAIAVILLKKPRTKPTRERSCTIYKVRFVASNNCIVVLFDSVLFYYQFTSWSLCHFTCTLIHVVCWPRSTDRVTTPSCTVSGVKHSYIYCVFVPLSKFMAAAGALDFLVYFPLDLSLVEDIY